MITPDQLEARLARLESALRSGVFYVPVLNAVEAEFKRRLFVEGKGADGAPLGTYSTRPLAIPLAQWPRKGAYRKVVKGGYKEFRILNGRQGSYVDLNLTGELFRAIRPFAVSDTRGAIGITQGQTWKLRKLQAKYPTAFEFGDREGNALRRAVIAEINAILTK